jgi:vesicle-associated membrane protein 7
LTEHTASSASNASSLPSLILPKISHATPQKLTYEHGPNYIHYLSLSPSEYPSVENPSAPGGLVFLVISPKDFGRRIPFGFLVEIKNRFFARYSAEGTDFGDLPAYGCAAFNGELKRVMIEYGTTESGKKDALSNVQSEIENVRGIMTENIERVLERGERIDLLVDKTNQLGEGARDFRVKSRGLRRRMWWKNAKLMVLLVVVCVFLVYLLVGFGCGLPAWSRCTSR